MTRVTVYFKAGALVGFASEGHAGFAAHGSDIVCAAISALTATCANALEHLVGIAIETREDAEKGVREVWLPETLSAQARHDAELLLRAFLVGAEGVARAYPNHAIVQIQGI